MASNPLKKDPPKDTAGGPPPGTETVKKTRKSGPRDPLACFMIGPDGIIETIIKPKIDATIEAMGGNPESFSAFCLKFRDRTGCTASQVTVKKWCEALGYKFEVVRRVQGFGDTTVKPNPVSTSAAPAPLHR